MAVQLDKVNPKFRQLTDLLFFSNKMDLDLKDFKFLLKENYNEHYAYMWDRFQKCSEIFWENGSDFWSNRFSFLLSLNEKNLTKNLEEFLEKRMFELVRTSHQVDMSYDIEYLQFVEYCKLKHSKKDDLNNIKKYLLELPSHSSVEKLINVVSSFMPFVFEDFNDYARQLINRITQSSRNLDFLLALEQIASQNFYLDRANLANLAYEIMTERTYSEKNLRAFFKLINDPITMVMLKKKYTITERSKLIDLLEACDYQMLGDNHLRNIKNSLELDLSIADSIVEIYAKKLYNRGSNHKKANADKLIRLVQTFPQISPRKILSYLSSNNQINDIKYVLSHFPDLKKLAVFV